MNELNSVLSPGLSDQLIEIRRHLHMHPELSFMEYQTSAYIQSVLREWDIPFKLIGETGVFVDIFGNSQGPAIGLRADIDALPIEEQSDVDYQSLNGNMHACGHDGHTAMLLGAVYELHKQREFLEGTVRCIFQPGEEADGAALELIEQGILENPKIEAVVGLHLWPYISFGTVGIKAGSMTASCDDFTITIKGKGGHSARPHQAIDAIAISAQLIQSLQAIAVKKFDPVHPIVIHIGKINGGAASNVVADTVVMEGTVRALRADVREQLRAEIAAVCRMAEIGWDAEIITSFTLGAPPIENDATMTNEFEQMARGLLGEAEVVRIAEPSMGADDFGYFSERVPSLYFRLGIKKENEVCYDLHHPKFQFDDQVLTIGAMLYTNFARHLVKNWRREK